MQQDTKVYPSVDGGSFKQRVFVKCIDQDQKLHSFKLLANGQIVQLVQLNSNTSDLHFFQEGSNEKMKHYDALLSGLFVRNQNTIGFVNQQEKQLKYLNTNNYEESCGDSAIELPSLSFMAKLKDGKIPVGYYENGLLIQCFENTNDLIIVEQNQDQCLLQHYYSSHQLKQVKEFTLKGDLLMYKIGEVNKVAIFSQEINDNSWEFQYYDGADILTYKVTFSFKQGLVTAVSEWINNQILIFANPHSEKTGQIIIYDFQKQDSVEIPVTNGDQRFPVIEDCLSVNVQKQQLLLKLGPEEYASNEGQVQEGVSLLKLDEQLELLKQNFYPLWSLYEYVYQKQTQCSLEVRYRIFDIDEYKIHFEDLEQSKEHRGELMNYGDELEFEQNNPQKVLIQHQL